jgi:AraC-like DNA-binding protein
MGIIIRKPAGVLANIIDYYWILEHPGNLRVHRETVYPQGSLQIIFYFGQQFVHEDHLGNQTGLPPACLCGLTDRFSNILVTGGFGLLGVVFKPYAAENVLRFPADELFRLNIPIRDGFGTEGKRLEELIFSAKTHQQRVDILDSFFLLRYQETGDYKNRISNCVQWMINSPANLSLKKIAERACLSQRQFERVFAEMVGTTPKQYHRISRLNFSIKMGEKREYDNLTMLALDSGFYDQAHLTNEFLEMTGYTPKNFFRLLADSPVEYQSGSLAI